MILQETCLEVSYMRGRPYAGYYYLPGYWDERSVRCKAMEAGLVVDFAKDGRPIGVEITEPSQVTAAAMNRVLKKLGQRAIRAADLAPFRAA